MSDEEFSALLDVEYEEPDDHHADEDDKECEEVVRSISAKE